jgi:hypothetical protein
VTAGAAGPAREPAGGPPVTSAYLRETPSYDRVVHGWVDAPDAEVLRLTVRLVDPWVGLEVVADATPSPGYEIRAAGGRVLVGPPDRIDPGLAGALSGLAGLAMTAGYTRRVAALAGARPGAGYLVDAAVEIARLARQVTRLPPDVVARHRAEGARGAWRLDLLGWADLPASCYTYRPEAAALFDERPVTSSVPWTLYAPPAGARGVFTRTKVARLARGPDGLALAHAMFDDVHSFQVWYLVDPARAVVLDAGSATPRLPYPALCSDPQGRVRALVGQRVDAALRRRLGALVGGPAGCAQLYDLTADLLRLLDPV